MVIALGRWVIINFYVDGTLYIQGMDRQQIQEMIEDNTKLSKYILINTKERACYARISSSFITEYEASVKNRAFRMNRVNKKYILEKDWR